MAENENVTVESTEVVATEVETETPAVVEEQQPAPTEQTKEGFGAKVKEWCRKQIVKVKRKTHMIPFFFLLVSGIFYLLCLNDFSQSSAVAYYRTQYLGIAVFVNVLFSILVLVLFLNAFPKHPIVNKKTGKKHKINYVMLVLGFVFIAIMIFLNGVYIHQLLGTLKTNPDAFFKSTEEAAKFKKYLSDEYLANPTIDTSKYRPYLMKSYRYAIAHIVLLGITVLMYALLPVYKMLIMKINTKKVLADNNIKEVIDTED